MAITTFSLRSFRLLGASAVFVLGIAITPGAHAADTPFIDQIPGGVTVVLPNAGLNVDSHQSAARGATAPTNNLRLMNVALPHPRQTNVATTVEIGNYNSVFQLQAGSGDESSVDIIGGNHNNVGVVQAGNNLDSSLLLIGTQGVSVGVLQGNHSAPVKMAIIRVPAGTVIVPHY
jgi:hypothetical protein